ncbi:MDR family MFS transporter [Cellulomonas sp. Root137]|uniref:MDR family MFS transporter n=1 Tax=Cellulomonas sp. Root137 TaxID=1736459 RepID=UPI0006FD85D3|nr:MDR family MFS transporter [Cellulomonas sp. Root137]KQY46564.1 MFS transporter [Cellulomonas sp. Root137]
MSQQSTAPTDAASATFTPPTHREILTILGGLMLGMFLAALDQTIVATSIRTIGDDLHGLSLQAWVTTAYLLTATISTPLYGKLSDIYGRKPLYMISISIFVVGSLLSGTADSMYQLAAYRGIQGLGAGGLMALAITILGDLVAPRERARYQAYFLAVFGTSSVLGPVVGGFFAGADTILGVEGWRWVFLINVPIGIIAILVISRVLHLPPLKRVDHRIDYPGAIALVVALVPLLVVAEQGRIWGWDSPRSIACYVIGVIGVVSFILAERYAKADAILPLYLFRNRTFSVGAGANTVIGLGMFGGLATLPLYLQIVKGQSPTEAGLTLIPFTLGIMTGSIVAGQMTSRTGRYKIFPVIGTILMGIGALLFSRLGADTGLPYVFAVSIVFGLGLGLTMQPLVLAVQNAVPVRDMGVATSSSLFFRQMGGTLGTAVFLSVLFSTVGGNIASAFRTASATPEFQAAVADPAVQADPANAPVLSMLQGGGTVPSLDDSSFINNLDPRLAQPFLDGFAQSVDTVLLLAAIIMAFGVVLTVLLPELPLRNVSGIQGRFDDDAAAAAQPQPAAAATAVGGVAGIVADEAAVDRAEAKSPRS